MKKSNSNLIKIINTLHDGEYHDGTTLGRKLQMTRSAIWKTIKKLQQYGVAIDSIKGKGYALHEPFSLLDVSKIKKLLQQDNIDIHLFETIGSTNTYLKSHKKNKSITICLSEQQTQGKGRLNREWHSPFGQNIYLSCSHQFHKDVSELAGLSLVVSLAVVKSLNDWMGKHQFSVKWPNDIVFENKKLSGSLIEVIAESHGVSHAIIGIGMNVNMMSGDGISQPWVSLQKITGKYVDRNLVTASLINTLLSYLDKFAKKGFSVFVGEWMAVECLLGKSISLKTVNEEIKGKVMGINPQGHLLLRLRNGDTQAFSSGDASIVKPLSFRGEAESRN